MLEGKVEDLILKLEKLEALKATDQCAVFDEFGARTCCWKKAGILKKTKKHLAGDWMNHLSIMGKLNQYWLDQLESTTTCEARC